MKTLILACPTIQGELNKAMQDCSYEADVQFIPSELHSDPVKLKQYIQNIVDNNTIYSRIVICASGCGVGTAGLKPHNAELIIPRTRDCLDILLSVDLVENIKRDLQGVFITQSWMEFMKASSIVKNFKVTDYSVAFSL